MTKPTTKNQNKGTLVCDNFRGAMTIYQYGDINSGRSNVQTVSGYNPFVKPGQLTWQNSSVQIDPTGSVITDLILAGKERVESGVLYVYAIGHTGRLYKIQVNDPTSYNPDYDNPVLLATLSAGSPTFTRGGFIDFFGATEQIYIGHDMGVTSIHFDGTTEAVVGVLGSWTQLVPRPLRQFVGKLYIGNGSNIAEIDSTATVTSYTKLSPGFPTNTQVRDLAASPDGTYLQMVVSKLALFDITSSSQDTSSTVNSDSFVFKWNGTDTGYTSFTTFQNTALTASTMYQNYNYNFGYDQYGVSILNPAEKFFWGTELQSPLPNAIISTGNILNFMSPVYYDGVLEADFFAWGNMDFEVGYPGFYDLFFLNATAPETDIIRTPCVISVSNSLIGSSSNGYANNTVSTSKIYFSTIETSATPTVKYRLYKWSPITTLRIPTTTALVGSVYQTQTQMFSKKVTVSEVRIYGEPWVVGNSFQIDLLGSQGLNLIPITNGSKVFTAGTNLNIGADYAWYGPDIAPTYAIGLAITNLGTTNHTINKIEIDWSEAGK